LRNLVDPAKALRKRQAQAAQQHLLSLGRRRDTAQPDGLAWLPVRHEGRQHHVAALDAGELFQDCPRGVAQVNARTDRRHVRRAFLYEEVAWLIRAAEEGQVICGMTGPDRAMLYRLAMENRPDMSSKGNLTGLTEVGRKAHNP